MALFHHVVHRAQLCALVLLLLAGFAACAGGGSGGSHPLPVAPAAPGRPALQATISVPANQTGVPIPLPTLPGITGTITLPANNAPPGTSLTITTSATLPAFVNGAPESGSVIFLTITLSSAENITFQARPSLAVTLAAPPANRGAYYAWMYDSINAWTNFATLAVSGNTLAFGGNNTPLDLRANVPAVIVPLTASPNAGCPTPTPGPPATPSPTPAPTPTRPPPTPTPTPIPTPSPTPVPTPVANPLYVARDFDILVFPATAAGNVVPGLTISSCTDCPFPPIAEAGGLALDSQHHLFVANKGLAFPPSVSEFSQGASGNAVPLRYIVNTTGNQSLDNTFLFTPVDVALDSQGEIFVIDEDNGRPGHINVYAANANGNAAPVRLIFGSNTGLGETDDTIGHAVAVDSSRSVIYATNTDSSTVTEYPIDANGNVAPARTIGGSAMRLNGPTGIALDASGNIYVANRSSNEIDVFPPLTGGNVAPLRFISGGATQISLPAFLAVDSTGDLYVSNLGTGNITVFGPGASGNAAPLRVLGGSNTGLSDRNEGIAVDR